MGLFRICGTSRGLMVSNGTNAMHHMFKMIGMKMLTMPQFMAWKK